MAFWYVSSANYNATPQWAANTPYTVGQLVRSLAVPAQLYSYFIQRCTTAGTTGATEPSWGVTNNATATSGTAVFTNVTGQQAYGWSAAAGNLYTMTTSGWVRAAGGDRIYLASDHVETHTAGAYNLASGGGWGNSVSVVSANRAGSVPPVAADIQPGATVNWNAAVYLESPFPMLWQGINFNIGGTSVNFNNGTNKSHYVKDCAFNLTNAAASVISANNPSKVTFDNTTVQFTHAGGFIRQAGYGLDLTWLNTPAAVKGTTVPTTLFTATSSNGWGPTVRGVDLSAITGTLVGITSGQTKALFDSCRIAPGVVRYPGASSVAGDLVELVNCFDGTTIVNERHRAAGSLTVDRSTVASNGAAIDSIGAFSHKLVSSTRVDRYGETLDTFFFDTENVFTLSLKIAALDIISSLTLNEDDVVMTLEYLGTAGSTLATYATSKPNLFSAAPLPISGLGWNNMPATPVKQRVQVSFTPQQAGRVRARLHLCRLSTTIWVHPVLAIG